MVNFNENISIMGGLLLRVAHPEDARKIDACHNRRENTAYNAERF